MFESIVRVAAELFPDLVDLIGALVRAGKSPEEARDIVRKDIQSRKAQYDHEKSEDEAALEDKHGRGEDA